MQSFRKLLDHREYHHESSIASYAGIMQALVEEYKRKFKKYTLESHNIPLAIDYLKDQVSALRRNAINKNFDRPNLASMAREIGINPDNYLDSINCIEINDTSQSKFVHYIHRDNYLEKDNAKLIYDYLKDSEVFNDKITKTEIAVVRSNDDSNKSKDTKKTYSYSFPAYIIKDLLDYVHIKTYLSSLDKLDCIIDNIANTIDSIPQQTNHQSTHPSSLDKLVHKIDNIANTIDSIPQQTNHQSTHPSSLDKLVHKIDNIANTIDSIPQQTNHQSTYLSSLDKLVHKIDNIANTIDSIPQQTNHQPKNLVRDQNQIQAHHLGFLLYLFLKKYGIDNSNNPHHKFTSYFLLMLIGEHKFLVDQISDDLPQAAKFKDNIMSFLKEIDRNTKLSPKDSPFIEKWFKKVEEEALEDIVNLSDRNDKRLEKDFAAIIKWSKRTKSSGCAFNLVKKSNNRWTFNSENNYLNILRDYYPSLITTEIEHQYRAFETDCLNSYA